MSGIAAIFSASKQGTNTKRRVNSDWQNLNLFVRRFVCTIISIDSPFQTIDPTGKVAVQKFTP